MRTCFVDESGRAAGKPINLINSAIRKDIPIRTGISQVPFYIFSDLGSVEVGQLALKVDALPDGGVCL